MQCEPCAVGRFNVDDDGDGQADNKCSPCTPGKQPATAGVGNSQCIACANGFFSENGLCNQCQGEVVMNGAGCTACAIGSYFDQAGICHAGQPASCTGTDDGTGYPDTCTKDDPLLPTDCTFTAGDAASCGAGCTYVATNTGSGCTINGDSTACAVTGGNCIFTPVVTTSTEDSMACNSLTDLEQVNSVACEVLLTKASDDAQDDINRLVPDAAACTFIVNADANRCKQCPEDTIFVSDSTLLVPCESCPSGKFSTAGSIVCTDIKEVEVQVEVEVEVEVVLELCPQNCSVGFQDLDCDETSPCTKCPSGKYSSGGYSNAKAVEVGICVVCAAGLYAPEGSNPALNTTKCQGCDQGRADEDSNAWTECTYCTEGTTTRDAAESVVASGASQCTPCAPGRIDDDSNTTTDCKACAGTGSYAPAGSGPHGCVKCTIGTYDHDRYAPS